MSNPSLYNNDLDYIPDDKLTLSERLAKIARERIKALGVQPRAISLTPPPITQPKPPDPTSRFDNLI